VVRPIFTKIHPKTGKMPRKGYYSPALRRDLVKRLYHTARELRVPMTVLNDRLVENALNQITVRRTPVTYDTGTAEAAA
jgi:hypothetical protein